jgi:hypothetical protein
VCSSLSYSSFSSSPTPAALCCYIALSSQLFIFYSSRSSLVSYRFSSYLISSCLISSCLILSCLILSLLLNSLDYFSPSFLPFLTMFMYIFIYSFLSFHLISLSLHTPHILLYSPLLYCTLFFLTLLLGREEQS